jgi:hypothetical protein
VPEKVGENGNSKAEGNEMLNRTLIEAWQPKKYKKVSRSNASVQVTEFFVSAHLDDFRASYHAVEHEQGRRLTRDVIDFLLRRYHQYAVQQQIGAHYTQQGVVKGIFEHLIPASVLRDLVLADAISIQAALHAPMVLLSKENDARLRVAKLTSTTRTPYYPFRRYIDAGIDEVFVSFRGETVIDLFNWSLEDHYKMAVGFGGGIPHPE